MENRAGSETPFGRSVLRRLLVFAFVPIAFDALTYVACLRFCGGDRLAAAFVAQTIVLLVAFAALMGVMAVIPRLGGTELPRVLSYSMSLLCAAMIVGLFGAVLGMGYAMIAAVAANGGRTWLACAFVGGFATGVCVFVRAFARRMFALGGILSVAAATTQAFALAHLGYSARLIADAVSVGVVVLVGLAVLAVFPEKDASDPGRP